MKRKQKYVLIGKLSYSCREQSVHLSSSQPRAGCDPYRYTWCCPPPHAVRPTACSCTAAKLLRERRRMELGVGRWKMAVG